MDQNTLVFHLPLHRRPSTSPLPPLAPRFPSFPCLWSASSSPLPTCAAGRMPVALFPSLPCRPAGRRAREIERRRRTTAGRRCCRGPPPPRSKSHSPAQVRRGLAEPAGGARRGAAPSSHLTPRPPPANVAPSSSLPKIRPPSDHVPSAVGLFRRGAGESPSRRPGLALARKGAAGQGHARAVEERRSVSAPRGGRRRGARGGSGEVLGRRWSGRWKTRVFWSKIFQKHVEGVRNGIFPTNMKL